MTATLQFLNGKRELVREVDVTPALLASIMQATVLIMRGQHYAFDGRSSISLLKFIECAPPMEFPETEPEPIYKQWITVKTGPDSYHHIDTDKVHPDAPAKIGRTLAQLTKQGLDPINALALMRNQPVTLMQTSTAIQALRDEGFIRG